MKICRDCGLDKPASDFTIDAKNGDGLRSQCRQCRSDKRKADYAANPQLYRDRSKSFRARNPGYYDEYMKEWTSKNKASIIARALVWNKTHPAIRAELSMRRYAGKVKATPKWADLTKIREIYELSRALRMVTGQEFNVDHIVPLRGTNVCGLHVEFNLQILTKSENIKKGNKHD